jgi:predicted nucleic acid-binding protein
MNWLLDVNVILASRWSTHPNHVAADAWLETLESFYTCPITELGFLRVSLSPGYAATWEAAMESLHKLHERSGYQFLMDDIKGTELPPTNYKDTTDAHLVVLAQKHGLRLATLDMTLVSRPWAVGIAANPLIASPADQDDT